MLLFPSFASHTKSPPKTATGNPETASQETSRSPSGCWSPYQEKVRRAVFLCYCFFHLALELVVKLNMYTCRGTGTFNSFVRVCVSRKFLSPEPKAVVS